MAEEKTEATAAPVEEPPPPPDPNLLETLSDGTKVKRRKLRQRACNEPGKKKGSICAGHLKRWFFFGEDLQQRFGKDAEIYRCEHCRTLYLPNPDEKPRTGTLAW